MGETVGYLRISKDRHDGEGVERQQTKVSALAKSRGHTISRWYVDNDITASKNVPRPEWEAMLSGIRNGSISSVYTLDSDRLTRKPRENEDLIDLAESHGLTLGNVMGDVDLATANGRMIFRIKGAVARQEAERISERVAAQKEQRAAKGRPMGTRQRVFGYDRAWNIVDDEATVIRDVFTRFLAGESKGSLTRSLVAADVRTSMGAQWSMRATMRLLEYAPYAGLYRFKGTIVGKSEVPAIVDEATFYAAQTGKTRVSGHTSNKHLLTNILICDACKAPMVGAMVTKRGMRYRCNVMAGGCGKTSIKGKFVDDFIDAYMSQVTYWDYEPKEQRDFDGEVKAIDERIQALRDANNSGALDLQDLIPMLAEARKQRQTVLSEAQAVVKDNAFEAVDDYFTLDVSAKRARIRRAIKYLFVRPWTGGKSFDPGRIYALMANGETVSGWALDVIDTRKYDEIYGDRAAVLETIEKHALEQQPC